MPSRLLAFNTTGSGIQLIECNEIFDCIFPGVFTKITEPQFQSVWAAAEALADVNDPVFIIQTWQHRQNKMQELLQEVVEQSVDYAILSHTWIRDTPGDITSQDWTMREYNPPETTRSSSSVRSRRGTIT